MKVLITGASSGIGRDMAYYFSKLGYDLVLVARRTEKMEEIKNNVDTNVEIISMDLQEKENCFKLYQQLKNENIDILVNNAGFGLFGTFDKTDLDRELEMINLNIIATHILTKLFLKDMIKKDSGYILNVCSSAGFMAGPRLNTYYATKNYSLKLTMAIYEELKKMKSNVNISALCPGPVDTEFNKVAKGVFNLKEANSYYVAKYAVDNMFKKKLLIIPQFKIRLTIFLLRFIPYKLQLLITYHIQKRKNTGKF
ncbi:MAG: SDR family oxidoreductase [Firmicutes bacterium]|nr:SDR family oxidoreductase [Bacillota bacterium]